MGMFDLEEDGQDVLVGGITKCGEEKDSVATERIQDLALDVFLLQRRMADAKTALDDASDELAMSLPPHMREVGEWVIASDKISITTTVGERLTWDQKVMKNMFDTSPTSVPDCVNLKFAVTKARYDSASQEEREALSEALTRSASKPKFKIEAI
jgi:predicted  nucleic acid-binding Zn-ribbon protein